MKRELKRSAVILCLALAVMGLYGCASETEKGNVSADQKEEDTDEGRGDLITEEEPVEAEDEEQIKEQETGSTGESTYLDKVNELRSEGLADQFALVNIDEDDVPELIASDSKGSFDHENAFIFTISNNEVVQLAGVITGVDGGSLDYAKGANLIHVGGAAEGMREVFSKIKDGKLEEVFTAEATGIDEDVQYSINGSSVKEDEYYEEINKFVEPYDPLTRIAYDGLYEISYKYENGYGGFEQGSSEEYSKNPDQIFE